MELMESTYFRHGVDGKYVFVDMELMESTCFRHGVDGKYMF